MIDFSNVQNIVIPEGEVAVIARGEEILWQKQTKPYKAELEYIESTGAQYIQLNTNFINTDECYAKAAMLTLANDKYFIAPRTWNNTGKNRFSLGGQYSGKTGCAYGAYGTPSTIYVPNITASTDVHIYSYINKIFTMEDTGSIYDATNIQWSGYTTELRLFYGYNTTNACRIYYYKQKRDGEFIVDLIPVLDWNDVPCMYDKVSGELFYNQGTGEFLYA